MRTGGNASVILIEFNELSPTLMERFIDGGRLPNFARFYRDAQVYVTEAQERAPYLEPWIQWITVHTGLTYEDHGIFNLDEGHKVPAPSLWDVLSDAGLRVWVCGSMNIHCQRAVRGAVLPDPWTTQVPPEPAELEPYFRFVQRNVLEHTNERVPLSARDYASFVSFMARRGLSAATLAAIARQLLSERGRHNHWRRATILDRLQLDVFRWYWHKLRPEFATFFSNSTAHFQHMFWRNMEPELFKVRPDEAEQAEFADAILYGYQSMDRMLGELMTLAGDDTTLVFCTALSQQPCLLYEEQGGKVFFRPRDFAALLRWAGVSGRFSVAPVMTQYFHAHFDGPREAAAAAEQIRALTVDGTQAIHVDVNEATLFCGCRLYQKLPQSTMLASSSGASTRFFDFFYQLEGLKSGMHHPDGMLWIRTPGRPHQVHQDKLPLQKVAPMILDLYGIAPPARDAKTALAVER